MKSVSPRFLLSLLLAPLGMLAGFFYFQAMHTGTQVKWRMLPQPPTTEFRLTASRQGSLFITAVTGQVLECYVNSAECWFASSVPPTIQQGWTIIHPCTLSGPEHLSSSNPPTTRIDCIEDFGTYAEFGGRHVYAVDADGKVWAWIHDTSAADSLGWCVGGQLFGLVAALVVAAAASPLVAKSRFFHGPPPSAPVA